MKTRPPVPPRHPDVDAWIAHLAALPLEARHKAIEAIDFPAHVFALVEEAATEVPERVALNFFEQGETLSYAALHRQVLATAAALEAHGIAPGDKVGVLLPNTMEFPLCWLALLRLGAVMVPVNLRYQPRELVYVLGDAAARWLIADPALAPLVAEAVALGGEAFPPPSRHIWVGPAPEPQSGVRLEDLCARAGPEASPRAPAPGLDALANIQYTSGTTGFPKGCMLTHRYWLTAAAVNGFRDARRFERVLASTPFFYMDPQWLTLLTLFQRGTLFVAERQRASLFAGWLKDLGIHFCLLPEIVGKQPPREGEALTELRRANIYGHRKDSHAPLRARFNAPAMEAFGMTEIGPGLYMPLDALDMVGSGSCGIPSPFREARIVDETGQDVTQGEVGELVIRGSGLMQGYYNRPDANAASYFGDWFRTGDLFRQDARGYFYIVGRLKDMVRRAGENIAAREVEAVFRNHPELEDVAVIPVPDPQRGEEVKIFLQPFDPDCDREALLARLEATVKPQLAAFKWPRYYEFIDELPRTASQKVAKGKLQELRDDQRLNSWDRVDACWR